MNKTEKFATTEKNRMKLLTNKQKQNEIVDK